MTETFLQMAQRHYDADVLAKGEFGWTGTACSIGCFNHDLGQQPGDFAALAKHTGYPEWAHRIQEVIFEGLPEDQARKWHVQFAKKAESVTDWDAVLKATMLAALRIALHYDTSEGQVVQRVIDLCKRDNVTPEEWRDAEWAAAWAAAWDAGAAWDAADAADAARGEAFQKIRDAFLNA